MAGSRRTGRARAAAETVLILHGESGLNERVRALAQVARRVATVLLILWFAWLTYERIRFFVESTAIPIGMDATIYHRGVVAWLHGQNPWDAAVVVNGWSYHYVGTPVTTVLLAPAALLSEEAFTFGWLALTWAAAVWTVRRLGLPMWWLLFPPIAEALFSANPQVVVLALLLANGPVASALATGLKVYAFIPLIGEGRWRQILVAGAFSAATILIAPNLWLDYIGLFGLLSSRLAAESTLGESAFYFPVVLAITAGALLLLALRDRRAAGWLAVPAVWPSTQLHYSTMALPVMSPFLAVFLAIPDTSPMATWVPHLVPVVIIIEAVRRFIEPWAVRAWKASMTQVHARLSAVDPP